MCSSSALSARSLASSAAASSRPQLHTMRFRRIPHDSLWLFSMSSIALMASLVLLQIPVALPLVVRLAALVTGAGGLGECINSQQEVALPALAHLAQVVLVVGIGGFHHRTL